MSTELTMVRGNQAVFHVGEFFCQGSVDLWATLLAKREEASGIDAGCIRPRHTVGTIAARDVFEFSGPNGNMVLEFDIVRTCRAEALK